MLGQKQPSVTDRHREDIIHLRSENACLKLQLLMHRLQGRGSWYPRGHVLASVSQLCPRIFIGLGLFQDPAWLLDFPAVVSQRLVPSLSITIRKDVGWAGTPNSSPSFSISFSLPGL